MAGTREGGMHAAATNKQLYGADFYKIIGRKGGKISRGGGFAKNPSRASTLGRMGGKASTSGYVPMACSICGRKLGSRIATIMHTRSHDL